MFIVDEVQTGIGATGHMWAHEAWELDDPPDMVSFSKKAQIGGYYYTDDLQMRLPCVTAIRSVPSRVIAVRGVAVIC